MREPREFRQGHIAEAVLHPLSTLISNDAEIPDNKQIVLVCRSGRRSVRAAQVLQSRGFTDLLVLEGGMLAWETAGLLEAVEEGFSETWQ